MGPHRCYQLKQAHIADLHYQAELARAARTRRQQRARPVGAAGLAARHLLAMLRAWVRCPRPQTRGHEPGQDHRIGQQPGRVTASVRWIPVPGG
jgi:hypothetical protein